MRSVAIKLTLTSGALFAALALLGFSFPFFAIAAGMYEGGEQSFFGFLLFFVFSLPATVLLLVGAYLKGWRSSRFAYYALGAMYGIPLLVLLLAVSWAVIDSFRHAKSS